MNKDKSQSVKIQKSAYEKLKAMAKRTRRTLSATLHIAIDEYHYQETGED